MKWMMAFALAAVPGAALAGSYRVVLAPPAGGKLLTGHAGVQAADDRTQTALVRLIAPGNEVKQRGTVRVLVMNLGARPFEFGPDQVRLTLGDGTVLRPVPVDTMEKGRVLVERENGRAAATDMHNKNSLDSLAGQAATGVPRGRSPALQARARRRPGRRKAMTGAATCSSCPAGQTLDAIYQILVPLTVDPAKAWGGYYVFELPKVAFAPKGGPAAEASSFARAPRSIASLHADVEIGASRRCVSFAQ